MKDAIVRKHGMVGFLALIILLAMLAPPGLEVEAHQDHVALASKSRGNLETQSIHQGLLGETLVAQGLLASEYVRPALEARTLADPPPLDSVPAVADPCSPAHTVSPGETLFAIASANTVSVAAIMETNAIDDAQWIFVGQELSIPCPSTLPAPLTKPEPPGASPALEPPTGGIYRVKDGDNLFRIGLAHGASVAWLQKFNGITDPEFLSIGQVIRIPDKHMMAVFSSVPVFSPGIAATSADDTFTVRFFNNPSLAGDPVLLRRDPVGSVYIWGEDGPAPGINRDNFSVSWNGHFLFTEGDYRFTASFDDGLRLYVNDTLLLSHWLEEGYPASSTLAAEITLPTGRHNIRLEYHDRAADAFVALMWQPLLDKPGSIPETVLLESRTPLADRYSDIEAALWQAVTAGDGDAVHRIIPSVTDVNIRNLDHQTPLHYAVSKDDVAVIEALLAHPTIDLEALHFDGETTLVTPLHTAARHGSAAAAEILLQHGANLDARDGEGRNPLHYAAYWYQPEVIRVLLANGADPNAQCHKRGWTVLHFLANWYVVPEAMELVLAHPLTDPNIRSHAGQTPLYFTALNGLGMNAKALLGHPNIDPNLAKDDGWTPLHMATERGITEIVRILLDHSAINPNEFNEDQWSPLHLAVWYNYTEIVEALASHAAIDINRTTHRGTTAYVIAMEKGFGDLMTLLMDRGADPMVG